MTPPALDEVGREYLWIGLALGRFEDGLVDAYYGPPEIRTQAEESDSGPAEMAARAADLRKRVEELSDRRRARWLDRQLVALETLARRMAGEQLEYLDEVERCFDARPQPTPSEDYAQVRQALDELVPGDGNLRERLDARDARLTIPTELLERVLDWLLTEIRAGCERVLPVPEGESLSMSLVRGQPWSAYNWYDGGLRSRVEVNTDLPVRAPQLIGLLTHETLPGHHLEHAWKEQRLYRERGLGEASLQLINTPEAYVSEGLAEVGGRLLFDDERWRELLVSIGELAGIQISAADADRERAITLQLQALRGSSGDAALQLYVEGRSRDAVRRFLIEDALSAPERADKSLDFIGHPLWRTYVFCYAGGEQLLGDWCAAAGAAAAQRDRFFRLLTEQLTPSGIAAELQPAHTGTT